MVLYFVLIIILLGAGVFLIRRFNFRRLLFKSLKMRLLSVRMASVKPADNKDPLEEINRFSQLLSSAVSVKLPISFEVAVHNIGEEIAFYVGVPDDSVEFMSRQIQGLWPEAQVELVEDYTIFNSQSEFDGAYLKLKQETSKPVRTFIEAKLDTFLAILSNFSKLQAVGEGLAMQVLVQPAQSGVKRGLVEKLKQLKKGKKDENDEKAPLAVDDEAVKALTEKLAKPLFLVNVRLIASAPAKNQAAQILESVAGSLAQFAAPTRNEFKIIRPLNVKNLITQFIFRQFQDGQGMTLGADEVASVFHFPTATTAIPRIKTVKAREAAPPSNLPKNGTPIGVSVFRGDSKPVFIGDDDRRRHVYVVGQTGTGKSNLLVNMAVSDIEQGRGLALIDPHGDLISALLRSIPRERLDDVIVFDPGDLQRPLGLNMLEYDAGRPEQKTFIVNEMQSIFNKLFTAETMGPMFEQYMRNALLLLMDDPNGKATLMEVPRVFTDVEYRKHLLAKATNPAVIDFWEKEAAKAGGEASLANMTPYITSKFNNFIANDYVRPVIGQPRSSFNFRDIMDSGKILLINLSKGRIGDINAGLLGMVLVGKILMAALSRVDMPENKRRDFYLYVDEFQNFTTDSIATILSEARKYRLNLTIAHQFIGQLAEKIRDAVFGNVGSQIIFRVGAEDAEFLVKQLEPIFTKNDLVNIDNYNAYVKLLINGQTAAPFNIRTLPAKAGDPNLGEQLKETSRQKYGRDRQETEIDILSRLRG